MKETFFEFYSPDKKKLREIWEKGLITLDANALLDLYRYSAKTRNAFLKILEKKKDRIWISHQFAFEYHNNRLKVIDEQKRAYQDVINILNEALNKLNEHAKHPFLKIRENKNKIESIVKKIEKLGMKHPDWFQKDETCHQITKLFKGKVGKPYSEDRIEEICNEGETRYANEIPPGYKDRGKKDLNRVRKFGDLIGWFQIIDKAKQTNKNIIFITGERKEDWWWRVAGKTISPRCELIREIYDKAGAMFRIYSIKNFLEHTRPEHKKIVDEKVIEEVRRIEEAISKEAEVSQKVSSSVEAFSAISNRGQTIGGSEVSKPTETPIEHPEKLIKEPKEKLEKSTKPKEIKKKVIKKPKNKK